MIDTKSIPQLYPNLKNSEIRQILVVHRQCRIPLQLSVMMLFKVMRVKQVDVAKKAGVDKTMIYKSLAGLRTPPASLKREMHTVLGMDVWKYKPRTESKKHKH
mgnify:CR=1 FL=1